MKKIHNIDILAIDPRIGITIIALWLFTLGSIIYIFILITQIYTVNEEINIQKASVSELKNKVNLIEANKRLTEDDILKYNQMLLQLIPETENYFEIITALERLSTKTNFILTNYTIDVSNKATDKFSLAVVGSGDLDTFTDFLKEYQFSSGRLITIERFEFLPDKVQSIGLLLNFYHKKTTQPGTAQGAPVKKLTQEDIQLMEDILKKTIILVK